MDSITHTHSVRRLYKADLPLFRDHLLRLDPQTRYDRFGLQVSDAYLASYADLCFKPDAITYGYFEDGVIRGAGELRMFASKTLVGLKDGEGAFSVERAWRRRGIGTDLMGQLVLVARNRNIATLTFVCLRHNRPMVKLAKKFETHLTFEHDDVTGRLVARAPSAFSVWREIIDNALDLGAAALDYQGRVLRAALPIGRSSP